MHDIHEKIIAADSQHQTEQLAEKIGAALKGGEVLELVSDLGGGKTTFVRGLARGMGSHERVASPTYTVSKVYQAGKRELHHYDFYRLQEGGMVGQELAEVVGDPHCVVAIEWGEIVQDILPKEATLRIYITKTSEHARRFTFEYPTVLSYLVENL